MLTVSVSSDKTKILQDALASIPGAVTRGGQRAVNSTATGLRNAAPGWVAQEYAIDKKEILSRLKVLRASGGFMQAEVVDAGPKANQGLPLKSFTTKKYQSGSSTRRGPGGVYTPPVGVPIRIKKAGGFKPEPGLFTQTMESGHTGLFKQRIGDSRRIKEQYLATPLNILAQGEYPAKVDDYVAEKLPEELTRQINRELASV